MSVARLWLSFLDQIRNVRWFKSFLLLMSSVWVPTLPYLYEWFWHAFKVEDLFYKPIFPLCHGRPQHLSAWAPRERIWANQGTLTFILKGISVRLTSSSLLVRNHLHQDKLWFFSFSKQPMARRSAILIIPTSELRWAFHGLMVWWYFLLVRACPIHFWFISDPFLITLIGFDSWIASHLHLALQILSV